MDGSVWMILSACASLCVVALAATVYSATLSDPARIRRALALVRAESDEIRAMGDTLRTVDFPRLEAACEAVLDRAEDRFDAAERKRKSISGGRQRLNAGTALLQEEADFRDPKLDRQARKAALTAHIRGG